MILVRSDLDFSIKSVNLDSEGRSMIIELTYKARCSCLLIFMLPTRCKTNANFLTI